MPNPQVTHQLAPTVVALSEALVGAMTEPAVVVCGATTIIAANQQWLQLPVFRGMTCTSTSLGTVAARQSAFKRLKDGIADRSAGDGSVELSLAHDDSAQSREFVARWRQVGMADGSDCHLTLVVLERSESDPGVESKMRRQSKRIDHLLVRQTLIEEAERRRIGRALHDNVAQTLAHVRSSLKNVTPQARAVADAVAMLDDAIASIRDLVFEFSPPVLEDLGLLPALRWLADDLSSRHHVDAACVDDGVEPRLDPDTRTVAFRAIRELATNAARHACQSEIVISSLVSERICRLTVRDTGPGFDYSGMKNSAEGRALYGLLSVEQQILALGGTFELVSSLGEGTRAVVIFPLADPIIEGKPVKDETDRA